VGEGGEGGDAVMHQRCLHTTTPTPNPSPQGGGERSEFAAPTGLPTIAASTRVRFKRPNPHSTHGARDMTVL